MIAMQMHRKMSFNFRNLLLLVNAVVDNGDKINM